MLSNAGFASRGDFSRGDAKAVSRHELKFEDVLALMGNIELSEAEVRELQLSLEKFNRAPEARVADNSNAIYSHYFCIGGKGAIVFIGIQGWKCIDIRGNTIIVGMAKNSYRNLESGLYADGYFGFNLGVSIMTGVLIHRCADGKSCDVKGSYYGRYNYDYKSEQGTGGTINGAIGPYGGFIGYYYRPGNHVALMMYQAGLAAEAAYSNLIIKAGE
mgnify:CR=1 FL=1